MTRATNLFGKEQFNRAPEADTTNHSGFLAFTRDLEDQYLQLLMTNTMGNTFYTKQAENVKQSLELHRRMLEKNPSFMAKAAVYARENGYTRLQPAIALAYLSTATKQVTKLNREGKSHMVIEPNREPFRSAFDHIIKTPNNLFDFLTVVSSIRGGKFGFGRTIKNAVGRWFNSLTEYHIIKYGADTQMDVKTGKKDYDLRDVLRLVRPVPVSERQKELFKYILDKEVDYSQLNQIHSYEQLKKAIDLPSIKQLIEKGRIPHEVATGVIKSPDAETWAYIMKQMPIMALMRNLNTLDRKGVFKKAENVDHVVKLFSTEKAVQNSRILPFRWITALQNFKGDPRIQDGIRMALNLSFKNMPTIVGKTHISIDLSKSMSDHGIRETAVVFGVAAYMNAEDADLSAFDLRLHNVPVSKLDSLMTNVARFDGVAGGGTALSLPVEHLLGQVKEGRYYNNWANREDCRIGYDASFSEGRRNQRTKVDNIVLVTDEEQNYGKDLLSVFTQYRKLVNPNAKLFIVNVGPYEKYSTPTDEPNVFQIFGWSDEVLRYISMVSQGGFSQRQAVEAYDLVGSKKNMVLS